MVVGITPDMRETIRSAAGKLTGYRRRQFQAEMAVKYCDSSPRLAEKVFGWARDSVQTGLHEHRTGIRCVERFHERGRKKKRRRRAGHRRRDSPLGRTAGPDRSHL